MKHPRTTILGILTIAGAVIHGVMLLLQGQPLPITELAGAVTAGLGLIVAPDAANVQKKN